MRKLNYYVACSVDGFIAHKDGTFDGFLMDDEAINDYLESLKNFDIVLMGRKTYEIGLKDGKTNPYPMMKSYVFSRTLKESPDEQVELISENAVPFIHRLKQETGQDIYLCGGANLATTLFAENLIDEITLKINPFLMGSGIPLFSKVIPQTSLELTNNRIYDSGITWLSYKVIQSN